MTRPCCDSRKSTRSYRTLITEMAPSEKPQATTSSAGLASMHVMAHSPPAALLPCTASEDRGRKRWRTAPRRKFTSTIVPSAPPTSTLFTYVAGCAMQHGVKPCVPPRSRFRPYASSESSPSPLPSSLPSPTSGSESESSSAALSPPPSAARPPPASPSAARSLRAAPFSAPLRSHAVCSGSPPIARSSAEWKTRRTPSRQRARSTGPMRSSSATRVPPVLIVARSAARRHTLMHRPVAT